MFKMFITKKASKVTGRYEDNTTGSALNVAITKTYGGVDPFEIILFYFPDKTKKNPEVIHRVILDYVGDQKFQGQARGSHGVSKFNEERIKNIEMIVKPQEFASASGQIHMNIEVVVQEYR